MNNILIAKNTQIEMLVDREYNVPEEEIDALDNLKKLKKLSLSQVYYKEDESIYVYYIEDDDDLSKKLDEFKKKLKKYTYGMIISTEPIIIKLQSKKYTFYFDPLKYIQLFSFDDLQYNVSQSILNGKYEKVAKSLIIPTIAHADELNILFLNDPIVKYYGYQAGEVIKMVEDTDIDLINDKTISYAIVKNQYI